MPAGPLLLVLIVCLVAPSCATGASAASSNWPKSLTLATASPGGVYITYGEAVAKLLSEKLGIAVNPLPTQGPVHNVKLLESGGAQLGMTTMGVALQGWNGTGDWTSGKHFHNMRALFPMYDTPFQAIVLQQSGITSFEQLNNKRIGVGPRESRRGYVQCRRERADISPPVPIVDSVGSRVQVGRQNTGQAWNRNWGRNRDAAAHLLEVDALHLWNLLGSVRAVQVDERSPV